MKWTSKSWKFQQKVGLLKFTTITHRLVKFTYPAGRLTANWNRTQSEIARKLTFSWPVTGVNLERHESNLKHSYNHISLRCWNYWCWSDRMRFGTISSTRHKLNWGNFLISPSFKILTIRFSMSSVKVRQSVVRNWASRRVIIHVFLQNQFYATRVKVLVQWKLQSTLLYLYCQ